MAPGLRLGWITSQPTFKAHLVRYIDLSTQHPSGFPQALVTLLLSGWGLAGFDRWVRSLRAEYHRRRAVFLELFEHEVAPTRLASASTPEAGMFVWIRVHLEQHPRYCRRAGTGAGMKGPRTNVARLMEELFERCLDNGLVVMPASVFALEGGPEYDGMEDPIEDVSVSSRLRLWAIRLTNRASVCQRVNYLRATFAGTEEAMEEGLTILGQVLREFFAPEQKL